jgi:hypothetical protein
MRARIFFLFVFAGLILLSCVPVEKIERHDFTSGYYKLKIPGNTPTHVYTKVDEDSLEVYNVIADGQNKTPDFNSLRRINISEIQSGNYFYKSCFVKNSVDVDLTTLILKYRPSLTSLPNQLNANINAAIYVGFRRDYYKAIPYKSPLNDEISFIRQIGFDGGIFAGIGSTFMSPSNTQNNITQEYDGMVFQKGVAGFITFDNMSVGVALGFDNLLDKNKSFWIYNQKPYIGLVIGISNF